MTTYKPLTTAERQRLYRERRAQAGETEVRGIYLPPELHKVLRDWARNLKRRHLSRDSD